MSEIKNRISLLKELNDSDYDAVIEELRYTQGRGYKPVYIVDMYEINNFCYPFGTRLGDKESFSKSIDYVADEQYVYDCLFNGKFGKSIFLDEYIPELFALKKFISKTNIEAEHAEYRLKKYSRDIGNSVNVDSFGIDKIANGFAVLLDQEAVGINKMTSMFAKKRILMESSDELPKDVTNAFQEYKGGDLTNEYYKFLNQINLDQAKFTGREHDRHSNNFRDARVLDRLTCVSGYLKSKYDARKIKDLYLVYYFSSARKSKGIFENSAILNNSMSIDGRPFNPLRTKAQLFLKFLCISDSLENSIANVRDLKNRIKKIYEQLDQSEKEVKEAGLESEEMLLDSLKKDFKEYREFFESEAILNKYSNIKFRIDEVLEIFRKRSIAKESKYWIIAKKIMELGEKTVEKKVADLVSLDSWEMQTRFSRFTKSYFNINSSDGYTSLEISTGNDKIHGSVQHLPILLEFTSEKIKQSFEEIVDHLMYPNRRIKLNETSIDLTLEEIKPSIELTYSLQLEEALFKAFVLLLAPPVLFHDEDINLVACNLIKSYFDLKATADIILSENLELTSDCFYFIGWTLRRADKIPDCLAWFEKSINLFPHDGRFYHGYALALYCESFIYRGNSTGNDFLVKSIDSAQTAIRLYKTKTSNKTIVTKSISALYNTIAYSFLLLHKSAVNNKFNQTQDYLEQARVFINKLKSNEDIDEYLKYPDYLHTESEIEFWEYKVLEFQIPSNVILFEKAYDKITWALEAIINAGSILYRPLFKRDDLLYEDLERQIRKEKKEFLNKYKNLR